MMAAAPAKRGKRARTLTYNVTGASRNMARKIILNGLMGYNRTVVGRQRWDSFAVVVNDARGRVLGGMTGWTGGGGSDI